MSLTLERVVENVREKQLTSLRQISFHRNKLLVVGVSGGPDSLTLLDGLTYFRNRCNLRVHGAHFNHGLVGESEEITEFVEATFTALDVPFTIGRADTLSFKRRKKISEEDAARRLRYTFLAEVASSQQADAVTVAHTADDQAETVLWHLIRGAGVVGICGMQVLTQGSLGEGIPKMTLLRPMLKVARLETEEYCRVRGFNPRHDISNQLLNYTRNRIRHQLLPILAGYNPKVKQAVVRLSEIALEQIEYINSQVDKIWPEVVHQTSAGLVVDKIAFLNLHPALQKHLLRKAIKEMMGGCAGFKQRHIEAMTELVADRSGRSLDLPKGLRISVSTSSGLISQSTVDNVN